MVLVVLTIVATAVMSKVGLHTADSAFRKYSADVVDSFLKARSRAIDEQTRVFLTMKPEGLKVEWIDPDTGVRALLWALHEDRYGGGVISTSSCNGGLYNGVVAPGETPHEASFACITAEQELVFFPDGSFGFAAAAGPPAGVTAILARQDTSGKVATVIEVYPGGNIRKRENVVF